MKTIKIIKIIIYDILSSTWKLIKREPALAVLYFQCFLVSVHYLLWFISIIIGILPIFIFKPCSDALCAALQLYHQATSGTYWAYTSIGPNMTPKMCAKDSLLTIQLQNLKVMPTPSPGPASSLYADNLSAYINTFNKYIIEIFGIFFIKFKSTMFIPYIHYNPSYYASVAPWVVGQGIWDYDSTTTAKYTLANFYMPSLFLSDQSKSVILSCTIPIGSLSNYCLNNQESIYEDVYREGVIREAIHRAGVYAATHNWHLLKFSELDAVYHIHSTINWTKGKLPNVLPIRSSEIPIYDIFYLPDYYFNHFYNTYMVNRTTPLIRYASLNSLQDAFIYSNYDIPVEEVELFFNQERIKRFADRDTPHKLIHIIRHYGPDPGNEYWTGECLSIWNNGNLWVEWDERRLSMNDWLVILDQLNAGTPDLPYYQYLNYLYSNALP